MRFMLMFYEPPGAPADLSELDAELARRGIAAVGPALETPENADALRHVDGSIQCCKGPLVQSAERLVGVRIIDCPDQKTAVELAALAPSARIGSVEVRAVHDSTTVPDFDGAGR